MNDFYERVHELVSKIPPGRVSTYGHLARYLGVASGARMVGYALNNSAETNIPAHRVVNRNGELTGRKHFHGDTMRERLEQEGIDFIDEFRVDLESHMWDPNIEIDNAVHDK